MMVVTRNAPSRVGLTLDERVTISNPFFLLVIDMPNDETFVGFITDVGTGLYNEFDLTLSLRAGDGLYKVYQKESNSSEDYEGATLLERGTVRIKESA